MKRVIICSILAILTVLIGGCDIRVVGETTGYNVYVETENINYSEIPRIETILIDKGYEVVWREKRKFDTKTNDVYTLLEKKFSDKKYRWVQVVINYVKDVPNNAVRYLKIDITNWYVGLIIPEIKTEIDSIGDLVHQELVNMVGKDNVTIERKEWGPPIAPVQQPSRKRLRVPEGASHIS